MTVLNQSLSFDIALCAVAGFCAISEGKCFIIDSKKSSHLVTEQKKLLSAKKHQNILPVTEDLHNNSLINDY